VNQGSAHEEDGKYIKGESDNQEPGPAGKIRNTDHLLFTAALLWTKGLRGLHSPTCHEPYNYHDHSDNQNNVNQASGDME
jgi:hypothetical protein